MGYDLSPLYRSTIGFDRLFDALASKVQPMTSWPPYNIEKAGEDAYRITMAIAGFGLDDIELVQQGNTLVVSGQKHPDREGVEVLHRGIATRAFKQTFDLADHVKVIGATLENGLLTVELTREVPEALKPRKIELGSGQGKAVSQDTQPQQAQLAKAA